MIRKLQLGFFERGRLEPDIGILESGGETTQIRTHIEEIHGSVKIVMRAV